MKIPDVDMCLTERNDRKPGYVVTWNCWGESSMNQVFEIDDAPWGYGS